MSANLIIPNRTNQRNFTNPIKVQDEQSLFKAKSMEPLNTHTFDSKTNKSMPNLVDN